MPVPLPVGWRNSRPPSPALSNGVWYLEFAPPVFWSILGSSFIHSRSLWSLEVFVWLPQKETAMALLYLQPCGLFRRKVTQGASKANLPHHLLLSPDPDLWLLLGCPFFRSLGLADRHCPSQIEGGDNLIFWAFAFLFRAILLGLVSIPAFYWVFVFCGFFLCFPVYPFCAAKLFINTS